MRSVPAILLSKVVTYFCIFLLSSVKPPTTFDGNIVDADDDEMILPVEWDLRGLVNIRGGNFVLPLPR